MIYKTHLAFGFLFGLIFLPYVQYKLVFILIVLISSLLPDIDTMHSKIGKSLFLRPLQWCIKHREVLHSFTFLIIFSLFLAFYFPIISLPFFLGYFSHLIGDSLTIEGIKPFWPLKNKIEGKIKTGGPSEKLIYYLILLTSVFVFIVSFY